MPYVSTERSAPLFGLAFHRLGGREVVDLIAGWLREATRVARVVAVADVAQTMRALDDASLRAFFSSCDLLLADGRGLSLGAALIGREPPRGISGPDLFRLVLDTAEHHGWTVYFCGAMPLTNARMVERLLSRHPALKVAGAHHGYFSADDDAVLDRIVATSPDIVFIGIASPVREQLVSRLRERVAAVFIPVGGVFDVEAGNVRRAPRWVQSIGLEFAVRIFQEPRRLLPRYLRTHSRFAVELLRARFSLFSGR